MASHRHPLFARVYPPISRAADRNGGEEHRSELLQGLHGRVIEIGAGHGVNLAHYPPTVTEVVAVEPEAHLRQLAERAAAQASMRVTVVEAVAEALPFGDGEFDAAVFSLVLCSVQDQHSALSEAYRVLRPDGELRYYEHVISRRPLAARVQRALDATVYPPLAAGCHSARDTGEAIRRAGFRIDREQRIAFRPSRLLPAVPHILGVARR